ncbi:MAG: KpsF/GutQ family sugar-phosphate isomerase [Gemmatimonadetes bacterium]|nr:KpsF/GutQ family sugar-phosphate isomerase [Gemmatimonadota bacterium]
MTGADGAAEPAAVLETARRVLRLEAEAVGALADRLGDAFVGACRLVAAAEGRVIVSGIGKSGIVGRKIAATLTSTGTPATFLHPVEGLHGDLGIVSGADVAVLISKSGETSELTGLVEFLARLGVPIIAMTGSPASSLGRHARFVLDCSVREEACPMDLAPTSSTTATLALGDALAVVVLQMKGFRAEDFALLHPGGALGRKLTVRVDDVMVDEGFPSLPADAVMRQSVVPIAEMRGTVPIVDDGGRVVGVVTAGDLTRLMERDETGWGAHPVVEVMTPDPKVARVGDLGSAAVHVMESHGVMALPVVDDDGVLRGVVHLHDLMRSGAV